MGYEEVSYAELQRYVSAEKMKVLDELFAHIVARDYAGIDLWSERGANGSYRSLKIDGCRKIVLSKLMFIPTRPANKRLERTRPE